MATFAQLLARQRGQQALQTTLSRANLQSEAADERKNIEDARREYEIEVEKAEREMKKRAKKRSRRRLAAQVLGTGVGLVTGNPLLGASITGAGSAVGAGLVKEYDDFIEAEAGPGRFFSGARADFEADVNASNAFIQEAAKGQNLLDLTNALQDAYTSFTMTKTFGKDFDEFFRKRANVVKGKNTIAERIGGRLFSDDKKPLKFFAEGSFGDTLLTGVGGVEDRIKARELKDLQPLKRFRALLDGEEYKATPIEIPSLDIGATLMRNFQERTTRTY